MSSGVALAGKDDTTPPHLRYIPVTIYEELNIGDHTVVSYPTVSPGDTGICGVILWDALRHVIGRFRAIAADHCWRGSSTRIDSFSSVRTPGALL